MTRNAARRSRSPSTGRCESAGRASSAATSSPTSLRVCKAASWSSTRWRAWAPSGSGRRCRRASRRRRSARSPAIKPCKRRVPGCKAIYCSGWQVAADANLAGEMYPDQSLYPANSVPAVVERINNALARLDQIESLEGRGGAHWYLPIVADAEAGFGGPLNVFELMKAMIEAGAAGRALRRSAELGEKVRPSRRQSADSDAASRAPSDSGASRGRRARRADDPHRAHRRQRREA